MKSMIKQTLFALLATVGLLVSGFSAAQETTVDPQRLAQRLQEMSQNIQKQPTSQQLNQLQQVVIQLQVVQSQLPQQLQVLEQLTARHVQLTDQFHTLNQTLLNQAGPINKR